MSVTTERKRRLSTSQIIILGFIGAILIGALMLSLPFSSRQGQAVSPLDALFTATSAVCVTGLTVRDTAATWSGAGQVILLALIQIGGMGVVTVAVALAMVSGRKISLMQRSAMQEAISAPKVGGIVKLTGFILRLTALFELGGAALLAPVFCRDYGLGRGLWFSLFHAVSAFCNAGFDLTGASLTGYAAQPLVNVVVILLIVLGGLGFLTWEDALTNRFHFRRFRMQTKLILVFSGALFLLPAVYFFLGELGGRPAGERFWGSLFQSVTMRTAGFNSLPLEDFSPAGQMLMIALMLVGGAPGSTAGGMKVTTLVTLAATAGAVFRQRAETRLFGRRIPDDTVRRAVAILTMYLTLFVTGGCVISRLEGLPLMPCLFETASAIGTVGVTLGLTPALGAVSKLILIVLMFCGRVGGLTLIFAALSGYRPDSAKLPQERLTVG